MTASIQEPLRQELSTTASNRVPTASTGTLITDAVAAKADRILTEGRLNVLRRADGLTVAACQGDHGAYELSAGAAGASCSCPAFGLCAHLLALALVTGGVGATPEDEPSPNSRRRAAAMTLCGVHRVGALRSQ